MKSIVIFLLVASFPLMALTGRSQVQRIQFDELENIYGTGSMPACLEGCGYSYNYVNVFTGSSPRTYAHMDHQSASGIVYGGNPAYQNCPNPNGEGLNPNGGNVWAWEDANGPGPYCTPNGVSVFQAFTSALTVPSGAITFTTAPNICISDEEDCPECPDPNNAN